MKLFGTSGIRGVINKEITPQLALKVGMALGSYIKGSVAVGHDPRTSSVLLKNVVISGLISCGRDVYDIGLAPTPTTGIAIRVFGCKAGVTVTASHNPPEYNGIKLWNEEGVAFSEEEKIIEDLVHKNNFNLQEWDKLGNIFYKHEEALEIHKEEIIKNIKIKGKYKVVIDSGNGAASLFSPHVFKELGNDVISINAHPTGYFSRGLEPNEKNLKTLSETVKNTGADLGVAHDGDADRVGIIDENGKYVDYDVILALIASYVSKEGDIFITTVDASMKIDRYLEKYGISVKRTKVGDVAVAQEIKNINSDFGGEPSGTWIFRKFQMTPDGIYSGAKVLEMKEQRGDICELRKEVPYYDILREKIPCENSKKLEKMKDVAENVSSYEDIIDIDGLRVNLKDSWFLIRPSGTEPYIRITCEAKTKEKAEKLMGKCKGLF
ncbi:MAG: phosphoglucosamine mutase [Methanomicrobia archaeon]|nr:phosphoglucosamine mutase [Methanomicrobia archaeon]